MRRAPLAFLRDEKGAVAVEFALVLPVFLVMIFGIICFGQYFAIASSLQQLAAESARQSVMGITIPERQALAASFITESGGRFSHLEQAKITASIQMVPETNPNGIQVLLTYDLKGSAVDVASSFLALDINTLTRGSYLAY